MLPANRASIRAMLHSQECKGGTITPKVCERGHICPAGTTVGVPCAAGTWSNMTGLSSPAQCDDCLVGHFCSAGRAIPCAPSTIFLVLQARPSLCCKEDISCVPIANNAHATFYRVRPIVLRYVGIIIRFAQIPGRLAEFAKKWHSKFLNFERLKNREDSSDFDDFRRNPRFLRKSEIFTLIQDFHLNPRFSP